MFSLEMPILEIVVAVVLVIAIAGKGIGMMVSKFKTEPASTPAAAFFPGMLPGLLMLGQHSGEIAGLGLKVLDMWESSHIHPADAKAKFFAATLRQLLTALAQNPVPMQIPFPTPAANPSVPVNTQPG